jgi:hypothetical protein
MDWQVLFSFAVVVLAVAGFLFLARTLWSTWQARGWTTGSTKSSDESTPSGGGPRLDWEDNACYRECMEQPFSGTGNQYTHCADKCGLR